MDQLVLTREMIESDIADFEMRIRHARDKLESLPASGSRYIERKKLRNKKRILEREIAHVNGLILIAEEALGETA